MDVRTAWPRLPPMDIRREPSPPVRIWHPPPVLDKATDPGDPAAPGQSLDRADAGTTPAGQAMRRRQKIAAQRFYKAPACSHTILTWHRRGARHAAHLWRRGARMHPAAGIQRREAITPLAQRRSAKRASKARSPLGCHRGTFNRPAARAFRQAPARPLRAPTSSIPNKSRMCNGKIPESSPVPYARGTTRLPPRLTPTAALG